MGPPLGVLPSHRDGGSHVPQESLRWAHARLHAGHRSGSRQAPPELHPGPTTGVRFRWHPYAFDTSSAVHFRSSSQRTPDGFIPPFPNRSPPWPLGQGSIRWFGPWSCNPSPRDLPSSLLQQGCFRRPSSRPPFRAVVAHSRRRSARSGTADRSRSAASCAGSGRSANPPTGRSSRRSSGTRCRP
jgi:hypothetical protein